MGRPNERRHCLYCKQPVVAGVEHEPPNACVRYLMARHELAREAWEREEIFAKDRMNKLANRFPSLKRKSQP